MLKRVFLIVLIGSVFCLGLMAGMILDSPAPVNAETNCNNDIKVFCGKSGPDPQGETLYQIALLVPNTVLRIIASRKDGNYVNVAFYTK